MILNSSVATIENENGVSIYKLNVDDGTIVYRSKVTNDEDIKNAIIKSIKILNKFKKYSKYVSELEAALN